MLRGSVGNGVLRHGHQKTRIWLLKVPFCGDTSFGLLIKLLPEKLQTVNGTKKVKAKLSFLTRRSQNYRHRSHSRKAKISVLPRETRFSQYYSAKIPVDYASNFVRDLMIRSLLPGHAVEWLFLPEHLLTVLGYSVQIVVFECFDTCPHGLDLSKKRAHVRMESCPTHCVLLWRVYVSTVFKPCQQNTKLKLLKGKNYWRERTIEEGK